MTITMIATVIALPPGIASPLAMGIADFATGSAERPEFAATDIGRPTT
jgi:hypothetical protein